MKQIISILLTLLSSNLWANIDGAYLDNKYTHLIHPEISKNINKAIGKNDVASMIEQQSPVRAQGSRGTCSIFSTTAYVEGMFDNTLDLSEEWLQYTSLRGKIYDGSDAPSNFDALRNYGMANEQTYPYIAEDWTKVFNPLIETRCGHILDQNKKKSCLIIHNDPDLLSARYINDSEFRRAREEAMAFRTHYLKFENTSYYKKSTNEIKNHLNNGKTLILEVNFYIGAWNHRDADLYGIGRNMDHWNKGIVFSAEEKSVDWIESNKHMSGHSVLIVGYDNNRVVSKAVKMADGSTKTFTHKGVYYFKNSWGTDGFGKDFEIDGVKYPGYGMIVQKYAHEQGAFFSLPNVLTDLR